MTRKTVLIGSSAFVLVLGISLFMKKNPVAKKLDSELIPLIIHFAKKQFLVIHGY